MGFSRHGPKYLHNKNAILLRNKVDLLEENNNNNEDDEEMIKDFCEKNKFLRCFKTSAKTGTNIEEAMNFLISNIIDKMEKITSSGSNPFEKPRESLVLQKKNHAENNKENNNSACC